MLAAVLVALGSAALANGQTTHIWITRAARDRLPPGELAELLQQPELEPMLVHGTMFPDGGYPLGHPYGETAHWEPFQTRYLEWIKSTWGPPYTGDAAPHVAFLMGLGSHGLADQTFDAFYLNRSQIYDADLGWADGRSMDEATDVVWARMTGAQEVPDRWVPMDELLPLFEASGIEVDADTLSEGQGLLELAVGAVGAAGSSGGDLSYYEDAFPWATSNLDNDELPGIPEYEADVIASYWAELWDRLHAMSGAQLIDRSWPEDGAYGLSTDPDSPDARISIIFKQGLLADDVAIDAFAIEDESGAALDFETWLYYGDDSHIVHLVPTAPWPTDAWLTVTVADGLTTRTGAVLVGDHRFSVSTGAEPAGDSAAAESSGHPEAQPKTRCGCSSHAAAPASLLSSMLVSSVFIALAIARRESS